MPTGPKGERPPANAMDGYASKPLPVFTKLAILLRIFPAVQLVIAKFAALLRSDRGSAEPRTTEFVGEALGTTRNTVDQHAAVLKPSSDYAIAAPESNGQSEREKLIRRRWEETGIKMWNPDFHGAGHAALNPRRRCRARDCRLAHRRIHQPLESSQCRLGTPATLRRNRQLG